jgi:hypothetical protein
MTRDDLIAQLGNYYSLTGDKRFYEAVEAARELGLPLDLAIMESEEPIENRGRKKKWKPAVEYMLWTVVQNLFDVKGHRPSRACEILAARGWFGMGLKGSTLRRRYVAVDKRIQGNPRYKRQAEIFKRQYAKLRAQGERKKAAE